jgi:hypothetical protein
VHVAEDSLAFSISRSVSSAAISSGVKWMSGSLGSADALGHVQRVVTDRSGTCLRGERGAARSSTRRRSRDGMWR